MITRSARRRNHQRRMGAANLRHRAKAARIRRTMRRVKVAVDGDTKRRVRDERGRFMTLKSLMTRIRSIFQGRETSEMTPATA